MPVSPVSASEKELSVFNDLAGQAVSSLESHIKLLESGDKAELEKLAKLFGYSNDKRGFNTLIESQISRSKSVLKLIRTSINDPSNVFHVRVAGVNGIYDNGKVFFTTSFFNGENKNALSTLIHEFGHMAGIHHPKSWSSGNYLSRVKTLSKHANLQFAYETESYNPRRELFDNTYAFVHSVLGGKP